MGHKNTRFLDVLEQLRDILALFQSPTVDEGGHATLLQSLVQTAREAIAGILPSETQEHIKLTILLSPCLNLHSLPLPPSLQ